MAALLEGVAAHATHDHMNALPLDAATLARALFDDVPSAVALCDATDLSLIAINAAARSWVGAAGGDRRRDRERKSPRQNSRHQIIT